MANYVDWAAREVASVVWMRPQPSGDCSPRCASAEPSDEAITMGLSPQVFCFLLPLATRKSVYLCKDAGMDRCPDQSPEEPKPKLTVGDIFRAGAAAYRREYGHTLTVEQDRALREIPGCRKALFGGRMHECKKCGHEVPLYNSCHNRSCPQCGGSKRQRWHDDRLEEMLPVEYYHAVFTVPKPIAKLALANPRVVYHILFLAARGGTAKTAREWSAFQASLGFTSMLHTCGQTMNPHPHIHAMIPCGGLSLETGKWVDMPPGFFLPKKKMANDFRDTFLALLQKSYNRDELKLEGELRHLACPERFAEWMAKLANIEWNCHASSLSDGKALHSNEAMERTVGYLARYASRVAMPNSRLISMEDGQVSFYYKDYRDNRGRGPMKVKKLPIVEFIRRFLNQVMPNRMQSSRPNGYLGNKYRTEVLASIREQLADRVPVDTRADGEENENPYDEEVTDEDLIEQKTCPKCGEKELEYSHELRRPTVNEIYTAPWRDLLSPDACIEAPDVAKELELSGACEFW